MKSAMIRQLCAGVLLLLSLAACAAADTAPVNMQTPPAAIPTQAEGELEAYDLTFPEEVPLAARTLMNQYKRWWC